MSTLPQPTVKLREATERVQGTTHISDRAPLY